MTSERVSYKSPTYFELSAPPQLDWRPYRDTRWLEYRRQWDQRAHNKQAGLFPLHMDIDPTNRCNLACAMCPRTYYLKSGRTEWAPDGRLGDMDFSHYEALIDQGVEAGLQSVKLNFLGEPLMHPRIADMVTLAAQAGLWVMINTNATLLTAKLSEDLLKAGLTDIFFSFDSPDPETYRSIRIGADYEKTLSNIQNFIEVKNRLGFNAVQTRASMVLPDGLPATNIEQVKSDYIKLFRNIGVAEIGFGLPTVMGLDYEKEYGIIEGFCCPDIFRRLFVFWDGPVSPCCGDWERRLIMGDSRRQDLKDIWHSEQYQNLRAAHVEGRYAEIGACRKCSVPYLSTR